MLGRAGDEHVHPGADPIRAVPPDSTVAMPIEMEPTASAQPPTPRASSAAIASALLRPDLQIDWLAQDPVTRVLRDRDETVHPASAALASESGHFEQECGEHDLHAFQAIRRMDDILVNNFGVFADLIDEEHYDLVIGDEAWDVDHFLHENPERKRGA